MYVLYVHSYFACLLLKVGGEIWNDMYIKFCFYSHHTYFITTLLLYTEEGTGGGGRRFDKEGKWRWVKTKTKKKKPEPRQLIDVCV